MRKDPEPTPTPARRTGVRSGTFPMVCGRATDHAEGMTETPHQTQAQPPGWNTQNLKDYRQLRRAREERKVAGVAGGLARHLDVDPTILRVLFVVLAFFG